MHVEKNASKLRRKFGRLNIVSLEFLNHYYLYWRINLKIEFVNLNLNTLLIVIRHTMVVN